MRLETLEAVRAEEWDATVESLGGSIFHTSIYARYVVAGQPRAVPLHLELVSDTGDVIGAALAIATRSPHVILRSLTGHMWLPALPVVRGQNLPQFLRQFEQWAERKGTVEVGVQSLASPGDGRELAELRYELMPRLEFELSLEAGEDKLWNGLEYKRRKNIKKAIRKGVVIEGLPAEEGLVALRRLQAESSKRIVARGGRDITYKGGATSDPAIAFVESGAGRLVGARVDGEVVSAGLFTCFNGLVYHTLSGHNSIAMETQAPTLLLWETIKRYRQEGATRFNFGGCSIAAMQEGDSEHGIYQYKRAFGGDCLECTSGTKILRPIAHGLVKTARRLLGR